MWRCQQLRLVAALPGVRGAHTKITNPLPFPGHSPGLFPKEVAVLSSLCGGTAQTGHSADPMSLPHGLGEGDEGWSPSPAICFKAHCPRPLEPPGDKDSSTGQLVPPQPQVPPELEGVGEAKAQQRKWHLGSRTWQTCTVAEDAHSVWWP